MPSHDDSLPPGALAPFRVLDLTGPIGHYCGKLLADLGADVVKVEPPAGDPARGLGPFAGGDPDPERSLWYINYNTNKRGLTLDLDQSDGRRTFLDLVRAADVAIESFAPGVLDRLGLGYEALARANPGLILTSITAFGQTGLYPAYRANDLVGAAMGGMMYITGEPHLPPCVAPLEQGYQMAGLHAAFGTLMALFERDRGGRGQHLDVSLQDAEAHMFFNVVNYAARAEIPLRLGVRGAVVPNGVYPSADGHVSITMFHPRHWTLLVEWMDDPVLKEPAWQEREMRRENADLIDALIGEFTSRFTTEEFVEEAQRRHIPAGPVNTTADFVNDPHVRHRGIFMDIEHPVIGRHRYPGPSFHLSATPQRIRRPAPTLGQHTDEIVREWGGARSVSGPPPTGVRRPPLHGVRVLDFSRVWAGPFGARFLADYGADVIRVESSKFPDSRGLPQQPPALRRDRDTMFAEMHRNKRSIALDMHHSAAIDLIKRLVATADVVVENYNPRVAGPLGYRLRGPAGGEAGHHHVRHAGLGGQARSGDWVAYGQQLMGYLGLGPLWRQAESPMAAATKLAYPDFIAAGQLATAVMAALLHRNRTGEGQFIEVAQIDATASMMGVAFLDYLVNGAVWQAKGNSDPNFAPHAAYPCQGHDRWVAIACADDGEWRALCGVMEQPDLAEDPRFASKALRHANRAPLDERIAQWTRTLSPHQVMHLLQWAGVPAGVVASAEPLPRPASARPWLDQCRIDHPGRRPARSSRYDRALLGDTPAVRAPAPQMGEHNDAVFRDLLRLPEEIYRALADAGVIV
ncbi:MAG: CoA transferase [Dehalococcoidia bacterium]